MAVDVGGHRLSPVPRRGIRVEHVDIGGRESKNRIEVIDLDGPGCNPAYADNGGIDGERVALLPAPQSVHHHFAGCAGTEGHIGGQIRDLELRNAGVRWLRARAEIGGDDVHAPKNRSYQAL